MSVRENPLTRQETFPCPGTADVDVRLARGSVEVQTTDEPIARVTLTGMPPSNDDQLSRALEQTAVSWAEKSGRLIVHAPRRSTLAVMVEVPSHSRVSARAASAAITVRGAVGRLDAQTGSGNVSATQVDGDVEIRTGAGDVQLGTVAGRVRSRAGSGRIEAAALEGPQSRLATGSGDLCLGTVCSDVSARTGNGNVRVADAAKGRLDLVTGSGDVWIGVRAGVAAEIDALSGSGSARSELEVLAEQPGSIAPGLRVRARTGSGSAVVARASA